MYNDKIMEKLSYSGNLLHSRRGVINYYYGR